MKLGGKMKLPEFKNEDLYKKWISRVNEYFVKNKISKVDNHGYYLKFFILVVAWIACWSFLVFYAKSLTFSLSLSFVFGCTIGILGINSMHDGGHFSVSKYKFLNNAFAYVADIMGGSSFFWKIKHNVLHHTYTNVNALDDDLNAGVFARLSPHQDKKPYHKFQHIYMLPMYGLLMFKWAFVDDYIYFFKKAYSFKEVTMSKKDQFMFFLGKIINISWLVLIPSFFHPLKTVIFHASIVYFFTGLIITLIFVVAHFVETAQFVNADPDLPMGFFEHQLATTADFSRFSKIALFISGGLNYQTVHHLTPNVNHMHYPALSKELEKFCEENNLTYHHFTNYWAALKSHFRFLKTMGK